MSDETIKPTCDCGYDRGNGVEYVCYECYSCKQFIPLRESIEDALRAELERMRDSRNRWRTMAWELACELDPTSDEKYMRMVSDAEQAEDEAEDETEQEEKEGA